MSHEPSPLVGFGNLFATEAVAGALPVSQNSPQRPPFGLYAEQISGSAFTAPRAHNLRTWVYRLHPSAGHGPYKPSSRGGSWTTGPYQAAPTPNRLRWDPLPEPKADTNFLDGVRTLAGNGSPEAQQGIGVHRYAFSAPMVDEAFFSADGDLLFVPQQAGVQLFTELGVMEVPPGHIAHVPRGLRFRVASLGGTSTGYLCENHGAPFVLPELGPIGANGLANPQDFVSPEAAYEDVDRPTRVVQKLAGRFYEHTLPHSPLNVVAWRGNLAPWSYDLSRFNTVNTVSFDHPDPSIFTVVTSPSGTPGVANCDFVIFPPRWMVAEDTFRPPWFHRNVMSELMGLVHGVYDAKATGFLPGGASLHNAQTAHGPDQDTWAKASREAMEPRKIEGTMAFMFETRLLYRTAVAGATDGTLQQDYDAVWSGFEKAKLPG